MLVDMLVVEPHQELHQFVDFRREAKPCVGRAVPAEVGDEDVDEVGVVGRFHMGEAQQDMLQFVQLLLGEDAEALGVFQVPSQIGNLVGDFHHAAFPGVWLEASVFAEFVQVYGFFAGAQQGLVHFPAMGNDAVSHGVGQVQVLETALGVLQELDVVHHMQGVLFVPEFAQAVFAAKLVKEDLARMPERRMPQVVAHRDGVGELGIEAEETGYRAADRNDMVHMLDTGADAVIVGMEEDLGLGFEPGVGRRMQDAAVVAVELAADFVGFER